MKIKIKNLGAIKQAEFTLGELTILCGGNNTGKTYATYALFGFLHSWRKDIPLHVPDKAIRHLLNVGSVELNVQDYINRVQEIIEEGCRNFTQRLPDIFASSPKYFTESQFAISLDPVDIQFNSAHNLDRTMRSSEDPTILYLQKRGISTGDYFTFG